MAVYNFGIGEMPNPIQQKTSRVESRAVAASVFHQGVDALIQKMLFISKKIDCGQYKVIKSTAIPEDILLELKSLFSDVERVLAEGRGQRKSLYAQYGINTARKEKGFREPPELATISQQTSVLGSLHSNLRKVLYHNGVDVRIPKKKRDSILKGKLSIQMTTARRLNPLWKAFYSIFERIQCG